MSPQDHKKFINIKHWRKQYDFGRCHLVYRKRTKAAKFPGMKLTKKITVFHYKEGKRESKCRERIASVERLNSVHHPKLPSHQKK